MNDDNDRTVQYDNVQRWLMEYDSFHFKSTSSTSKGITDDHDSGISDINSTPELCVDSKKKEIQSNNNGQYDLNLLSPLLNDEKQDIIEPSISESIFTDGVSGRFDILPPDDNNFDDRADDNDAADSVVTTGLADATASEKSSHRGQIDDTPLSSCNGYFSGFSKGENFNRW